MHLADLATDLIQRARRKAEIRLAQVRVAVLLVASGTTVAFAPFMQGDDRTV